MVHDQVGHRADAGADLVAQHVADHGCAAPVGHGQRVQPVLLAQQLDEELRHRGRCRQGLDRPQVVSVERYDQRKRRQQQRGERMCLHELAYLCEAAN